MLQIIWLLQGATLRQIEYIIVQTKVVIYIEFCWTLSVKRTLLLYSILKYENSRNNINNIRCIGSSELLALYRIK